MALGYVEISISGLSFLYDDSYGSFVNLSEKQKNNVSIEKGQTYLSYPNNENLFKLLVYVLSLSEIVGKNGVKFIHQALSIS